jgi:galactokinase
VTSTEFREVESHLDPLIARRARHVILENERVTAALACLEEGDLATFGRLMNESHASLRHDYQVSIAELDHLVGALQDQPGVMGARLTGAGFGGCLVAIGRRDVRRDVEDTILPHYRMRFERNPTLWACQSVKGAEVLTPASLQS